MFFLLLTLFFADELVHRDFKYFRQGDNDKKRGFISTGFPFGQGVSGIWRIEVQPFLKTRAKLKRREAAFFSEVTELFAKMIRLSSRFIRSTPP
jgi:hypothetical protein